VPIPGRHLRDHGFAEEAAHGVVRSLQSHELHEVDEHDQADPHHGRQDVQQTHQEGEHLHRVGRDQADHEQHKG
jgi:hypothetical protein